MPDTHWRIEQGCPQCGAPATLDETDRLLACPFCRTRLYLVSEDHFHYYIPPAAKADGELFYFPYRRLRGSLFSVNASEVTHRFIDANTLAVNFPGLPHSLGLRPQALKLRFVTPAMQGRFIAPDLPAGEAVPGLGKAPHGVLYQEFIGETVSLIHAPLLLRGGTLYDAVLGEPISVCKTDDLERLEQSPPTAQKQVRFIPTLCPYCGWDMEGEKDSLVLICRNCNSAWDCLKNAFQRVEFTVMRPPAESGEIALYLPFWRMKPRIEGMELTSYADLIRAANLPKAITPAFAAAPLYFWSPAFKVNPFLYSRWARQMTLFRPIGDTEEKFPETALHPVTLPLAEAAEGIIITLAQMSTDKQKLYPKLAGLRITLEGFRLEYHPFTLSGGELIHASLRFALDRTALSYGLRL